MDEMRWTPEPDKREELAKIPLRLWEEVLGPYTEGLTERWRAYTPHADFVFYVDVGGREPVVVVEVEYGAAE